MDKVMSVEEAVLPIKSGCSIMIGGFGGQGSPHTVIDAVINAGADNLRLICNDAGTPNYGAGRFLREKRVKKLTASFIGPNPEAGEMLRDNEIEIELMPQGTLAEAIRAGGAGLGGVLTKTGLGTLVQEGKEVIAVDGVEYLLEPSIKADVALIYASKADRMGNVVYHGSSRAHSPSMATAADYVIVEVDEIVDVGVINPDDVHTQSIYINAVVLKGEK